MDDILLEAAAEVEAKFAAKKVDSGDILMEAAEEAAREQEDDHFADEEDIDQTKLSKDEVKNILREAARSVDMEDAAEARDALRKAAESLEPIDNRKLNVRQHSSHSEDRDIGQMLNDAAEEVLHGLREFADVEKDLSDDEESSLGASDDADEDLRTQYSDNNLFMISVYRRDMEAIDRHLRKGADVMHRDQHGWTALHWAAAKGFDDVLDVLIQEYRGNNMKRYLTCKDHITGWTPLHVSDLCECLCEWVGECNGDPP